MATGDEAIAKLLAGVSSDEGSTSAEGEDSESETSLEVAADDIIEAMKSGDSKSLVKSLKAFYDMYLEDDVAEEEETLEEEM